MKSANFFLYCTKGRIDGHRSSHSSKLKEKMGAKRPKYLVYLYMNVFYYIDNNYKITRIDNLINSIVVTVNEINASFTIDKKELPANMRFDMSFKIEAIHIPDNAKIKFYFINWNKTD